MNPPQVRDIVRTDLQILIARVRMVIGNGAAAMLAGSTVLNITVLQGTEEGKKHNSDYSFHISASQNFIDSREANLETPSAHYHC